MLQAISTTHWVLIGEASHGTQEFYEHRAEITKQLILHYDFDAALIEGDWPAAYTVNLWAQNLEKSSLA